MEKEYLTVSLFKKGEQTNNVDLSHIREDLLRKALETNNERFIVPIRDCSTVELDGSGDFIKFLIKANEDIKSKELETVISMFAEIVDVEDCCCFIPF